MNKLLKLSFYFIKFTVTKSSKQKQMSNLKSVQSI